MPQLALSIMKISKYNNFCCYELNKVYYHRSNLQNVKTKENSASFLVSS
jgi:hypothetical protein